MRTGKRKVKPRREGPGSDLGTRKGKRVGGRQQMVPLRRKMTEEGEGRQRA